MKLCGIEIGGTYYGIDPGNRSQIDINVEHVIFKPGKNISQHYPPPTLIHLFHRFTSAPERLFTVV
jgi:hypothetical protein